MIAFDDHLYLLAVSEPGKEPEYYRAFETPVDGQPFLNVQRIGARFGGSATFNLATYRILPDGTLQVRFVDEHALPRSVMSEEELRKRVSAGKSKEDFFEKDLALGFTRTAPGH